MVIAQEMSEKEVLTYVWSEVEKRVRMIQKFLWIGQLETIAICQNINREREEFASSHEAKAQ